MKRFRVLSLAMAALLGVCHANAQTDNTFCFIDANGNEVKDGSTVTFYAVEEEKVPGVPFFGVTVEAKFNLSVKNASGEGAAVASHIITVRKSNGDIQYCFPNQCQSGELPEDYKSDCADIVAGGVVPLNSEWYPAEKQYGEALCTIQLLKVRQTGASKFDYEVLGYGPTVNIHCIYADPTGVKDLSADENATEIERYDISGKKLSAPKKGINLVKLSNGKVFKTIVK